MKLIKDILKVIVSNFIMLGSNFVIGFILPATLTVDDYGLYKQYLLYSSYIAIFNLGFIDGIYIKYGGISVSSIDSVELKKEHKALLLFQLLVSVIMLLISIFFKSMNLFFISLTIIPINISGFHKLFYQATGQFGKYSKNNILFAILNIMFIFILVFLVKTENYASYIVAYILVNFLILCVLEFDFKKMKTQILHSEKKSENLLYPRIKVGIFVLLANISVQLFNTVGLWMTNFFLSIDKFAQYSFANSMLSMILLLVSAAGLTFYNYIAKKEDKEILFVIKDLLLILGLASGLAFFVLKFIILTFLGEYINSLDVISISFVSIPYIMVINVLVINLYKARKKEKKYLEIVAKMLFVNIIINVILFMIYRNTISVALGTTISFIIWYFYSINVDFNYLKSDFKQVLLLISHFIIFIYCSHYLSWLIGMCVYLVFIIGVLLFSREKLNMILKKVRQI